MLVVAHVGECLRIVQSKSLLRSARSLPCFDTFGFPKGGVDLALRSFPQSSVLQNSLLNSTSKLYQHMSTAG